ncbi:hypothetical protein RB597_001201 [Gaeumannomyces tritici]
MRARRKLDLLVRWQCAQDTLITAVSLLVCLLRAPSTSRSSNQASSGTSRLLARNLSPGNPNRKQATSPIQRYNMHFPAQSTVLVGALAILGGLVEGKTDLAGCTKYTTMVGNVASVVWFVPDTLEICSLMDCGGGRAPPKSKPGCPLYQGPETVTPSFLESNPLKTSTPAPASSSVRPTLATPTSSSVATSGSGTGAAASSETGTTAGPGASTAVGSGANSTAVLGTGATGGSGSAAITSPPTSKTGASTSPPSAPAGSAAAPVAVMRGLPVLMGLAATVLFL